jgi:deazaflavin-dependent oxidoreductase (nitroreductase family)
VTEENKITLGFESVDQLLSFNEQIAAEFRANDGKCGGRFEGNPMVLLTMAGAKSGRQITVPLSYCADGDDCIVFASAGGSPKHPQWYFNLKANPTITVERGTESYESEAVLTEGAGRQYAFDKMVTAMPRFGDYQAGVEREIPVFRLVRQPAS